MKKIVLLVAVALFTFVSAQAQSSSHKVYCELVGTQKLLSVKVTVQVDFGQTLSNSKLVDESGKSITFNSMVDAMNYMGKLGWEFESAYIITEGKGLKAQNVYRWLLSKYISEGENINEGFITKRQFKDMQRSEKNQQEE